MLLPSLLSQQPTKLQPASTVKCEVAFLEAVMRKNLFLISPVYKKAEKVLQSKERLD